MVQAKQLWRSVKTVLLIPKGSDAGNFCITTRTQKLSVLTVCCFTQVPKKRVECNIFTYLYALTAQALHVLGSHINVSIHFERWRHHRRYQISLLLWRRYAVATVYCNDTTYCHSVFSLQQTSFHLTPLWKSLFWGYNPYTDNAALYLSWMWAQTGFWCGTLRPSYMVNYEMLWASSLFEEQKPKAQWNEVDAHEFKVDSHNPGCWIPE